jgi:hypothetical protein
MAVPPTAEQVNEALATLLLEQAEQAGVWTMFV